MLISPIGKYSQKGSKFKWIIISFAVFMLVFFLLRSFIQPMFLGVASKFQDLFSNESSISLDNQKLKNRVVELENIIKSYNDANLLLTQGATDFIHGSIIIRDVGRIYDTIYINKGSNDSISVGSTVFVSGLRPIGKIIETQDKFSHIELFTKENLKTSGVLKSASSTEEMLELVGDGAYGFMASVPAVSKLSLGDNVYFAENPDFVIGIVSQIVNNEQENNKIVRVTGFYSSHGSVSVFIQK